MTINYSKLINYIAVFLAISVFVLIIALSTFEITDFDTMHKLASGRFIMENGFTKECVFNYSKTDCQPIFMVEWLFHVLVFAVYSFGDWSGLVLLQILIILGIFISIFLHNFKASFSLISSLTIILIASLVASERFMLRADLFAILLAVLFYITLKQYEKTGKKLFLISLVLIQILWANIHGSFPVAYFIVLCFLGPHVLKSLWENLYLRKNYFNKKSLFTEEIKKLSILFLLIILASFINPYGYDAFAGVIGYLTDYSPVLRAQVKEFRGTFEPRDLEFFTIKVFKLLSLITLILFSLNFKKIKLQDLVIVIGFLYLAVTSVRNIALFSVFTAMILPFYLDNIISYLKRLNNKKRFLSIFFKPILLIITICLVFYSCQMSYQITTNQFYNHEQSLRRFGFGVSEISYPFKAVEFVKENNLQGNMFNNFSLGSFLNWTLFPERKTFIDNHTWTIESFKYYDKVVNNLEPISDLSEKYDINYFILTHLSGDTLGLINILYNDPNWILIYFDELAVIFIKADSRNFEIIQRFIVDLESNDYNQNNLTFKDPINFSRGYSNRGIFLANLGFLEQALWQYQKAIEINNRDYGSYHNIGLASYYLKNYEKAEQSYLKSIELRSDFAPVHYNLGMLYHQTDRHDQALKEYEKTLKINHGFRLANYHIGIIYEQKEDFEKAKNYYEKELKINPNLTVAQNAMSRLNAKILPEKSNINVASIESIMNQIESDPDNGELYFELGVAYGLEQKHEIALQQFKKAIELDPKHHMARFNLANIYSLKGMHEDAEKEYLSVIEINPDLHDAYLNLGIIYRYHKKNNQKALENWQKFIELAPNDPQAAGIKQEIAEIIKEESN